MVLAILIGFSLTECDAERPRTKNLARTGKFPKVGDKFLAFFKRFMSE
jgi:hypothetical protein